MRIQSRYQAFGSHLLGSATVAACCAALVFLVWYPGTLAYASGVTNIFLTLLAVDVVIGPVITLIVFDRKKKELKRDLLVVLMLQLAALSYGMHAVFSARPVYVVFTADRFDLVFANSVSDTNLAKATHAEFKALPWLRPRVIATQRPDDPKVRQELMFGALTTGEDIQVLPQFYVPYDTQKPAVIAKLQALPELQKFNARAQEDVAALIARHAGEPGGVGFLPVRGKVEDLTAVVSKATGEIIELVPLAPWH